MFLLLLYSIGILTVASRGMVQGQNQSLNDVMNLVNQLNQTVDMLKHNVTNLYSSLAQKEKQISTLENALGSNVSVTPVAFYAWQGKDGTLSPGETIIYETVITNVGYGYHAGIFTAPFKGVYMFSVTVMGKPNNIIHLNMIKNGNIVGSVRSGNTPDLDSGTKVVVLTLDISDRVWMRYFGGGTHLHGTGRSFNTFSGFLIQSM